MFGARMSLSGLDAERWLLNLGLLDRLATDARAIMGGPAESSAYERWMQFIASHLELAPWLEQTLAAGQPGPDESHEAKLAFARSALDRAVKQLRRDDDPGSGSLGLFRGLLPPRHPLTLDEVLAISDLPDAVRPVASFLLVMLLLNASRAAATELVIRPQTLLLGDLVEHIPDFTPFWDDEESFQAGAAERLLKRVGGALEPGEGALLEVLLAALRDREVPEAIYHAAGQAGVPHQAVIDLFLKLRRWLRPRGRPDGND